LSIAKIAPFPLGSDGCIAPAAECPDRNNAPFVAALGHRENDSFRTKSHTRMFTAALTGESHDRYDWRSTWATALNVSAVRFDSAGPDQATNTSRRLFSGKNEIS
jgi:hypothetical protein